MSWVLTLVSDLNYLDRALNTIMYARIYGGWIDDIVLITDMNCAQSEKIKLLNDFNVDKLIISNISTQNVLDFWEKNKTHDNYNYVKTRPFIFSKFFVMDSYFKKWDYVFYVDSGVKIFDSLERFKNMCKPERCFYAHSDAYPTYEWKLRRQFSTELDTTMTEKLCKRYGELDCDYFQTTIFIYDTKIIEDDFVKKLFDLVNEYPFSWRMDQGIFNLLIKMEKNLWKQIPIRDSYGFLYDYLVRPGYSDQDYCILKLYK